MISADEKACCQAISKDGKGHAHRKKCQTGEQLIVALQDEYGDFYSTLIDSIDKNEVTIKLSSLECKGAVVHSSCKLGVKLQQRTRWLGRFYDSESIQGGGK